MSSWSGSHPPPPPRLSRSRSPSRGAYGQRAAYPDTAGHPQDPYRADWDAYNRERAWADYERDRAVYDYGRRGRSRSPPFDEGGRKRRRSLSPYDRDRYDPRPRYSDDYDAHSRGYGHMSPRSRGQYGQPYASRSSRAPPDPHTFDYPATLKQYAEWFRYFYPQQASEEDIADKAAEQEAADGTKPRNGIKAKWEKYKKDFTAQQLQTLFDHHRKSPWFAEKYDPSPEFVNLRMRVKKIGRKGRLNQFLNDLAEGKFDPKPDEPEPSSPSVHSKEVKEEEGAAGENGATEDAVVEVEVKKEDGDFGGMDVDEEAADNDVSKPGMNGKGPDDSGRLPRSDEVAVFPEGNQVMIRTIPPDIGRVKLEGVMKDIPGFRYLALGDPMQKRNYYRAGWIKFDEDAEMVQVINTLSEKKIEGFKLHVNHSTRPFINRIRQAPEVASKPERIAKDLEQAKKLVAVMEEDNEQLRQHKIDIASPAPAPPPKDGEDEHKENGEADQLQADVSMAIVGGEEKDGEPKEKGSEAVEKHIAKLVAALPEPTSEEEEKNLELKKNTIALDLYLDYLRAAFHTCYYCASVSDHLEELQRKCIKHVRKPLAKHMKENPAATSVEKTEDGSEKEKEKEKERESPSKEKPGDSRDWKRDDNRWLDWLDNKIALFINKDGIDVHDYGGKSYSEELTKAVEPHIKQFDEGKFRCKTCTKLFKATSFVEKHVANKHPELIKQLDDLPYFNNFALDPQRIQPFSHPPPPVGNSQAPPPQAYGIAGPSYPDHRSSGGHYGGYPPSYPPSYSNGGHWDHHAYQYGGYPPPSMPPTARSLRDEPPLSAGGGRRLSERITGYAQGHDQPMHGHGIEGLPAKPIVAVEPGMGGRRSSRASGPPPPPPPDAKEDPRAAAGKKVSYHDMDEVAEGDIELPY
ncbi:hypothetical protein BD410DRAFT_779501 [Rickenella mellea]|uniref:C2H2-type domain-containing protein n=1 Tax=Rickenella mellea TaxID=50990 RepID=A0A4R5XFR6_9AGAM|nr:hypothetical protein BD410DRAFT_779501 [Rickenella mellea]